MRFLGGYHMITAKEARERIDTLKGSAEQKEIEESITEAVKRGYSYCRFYNPFSDATEGWLKSLGYQIEDVTDPRDGIFEIEVRW